MKSTFFKLIVWGLTPVSVIASLTAYTYAIMTGNHAEIGMLIVTMLILVISIGAERCMPFNAQWNQARQDRSTDYTSFAVLAGVVQPTLKWLSPLFVVGVYAWLDSHSLALFSDMGLVLQIAIATLLAELGKYAVHRWHHANPRLWWLHALHHSSMRLYSINGFRTHPLEYAIKHTLSMLPLILLGMPAEALLGYIALTQPVQMLQHVNLPLRHGWLNYIFSTNELHRWHHSTVAQEANSNYGSAIVLWDIVFGTYRKAVQADGQTAPVSIGLFATTHYPAARPFFTQVVSMFSPGCCKPA